MAKIFLFNIKFYNLPNKPLFINCYENKDNNNNTSGNPACDFHNTEFRR